MENVGMFYAHLVHFTAILNILWLFCICCGHLVYFSPFWYVVPRKNLATLGGTGLANILGERTPCKKLADLHPRQGNLI
jgi:hypothetical protein